MNLDDLRASQQNDRILPSDVDLGDYLAHTTLADALRDLEPVTPDERAHLALARARHRRGFA